MSQLFHGDCLEVLQDIDDDSVDFIFCDLPYATKTYSAVSCKWNTPIDLDKFWIEMTRVKKLNTPIFMTCNTKFGVDLKNFLSMIYQVIHINLSKIIVKRLIQIIFMDVRFIQMDKVGNIHPHSLCRL